MKKLAFLCTTALFAMPATGWAQSTGTVDFEESEEIVVTGARTQEVGGVITPDTSKARQVLTQETIARQNPGQTILDTINLVPGVTFTNNDAYGNAGGQLSIRGFSADRISLTFDGVPQNDSGNYAIYASQQLDPELIEQVNVNLGTTDVDSPTAAATGSTVNYRTRTPGEEFGAMLSASVGEFDFHRLFGMIDTGDITGFGTRAFVAGSFARNRNPYNNYGRIRKQQFNGRIYQELGAEGDFISLAGHYSESRNNFFGSLALGTSYPDERDERDYTISYPCNLNTAARPGLPDTPNTCGTEFDRRYNPSNTGKVNMASRLSLSDSLTLTVDPYFTYTKANGGGTVGARERTADVQPGTPVTNLSGYIGGRPYFGMDLNGDGDMLDEITLLAPSQTQTHRLGVIANLRYDINEDHSVRVGYTWDRARHRQTGEVGGVGINGEPEDVFAVNVALADVTGVNLQKRDRLSYAILHQISGEYRGSFMDGGLVVTAGVRAPFFTRNLNNYCFTTSDTGFVDCFGIDDPRNATYATLNPTVQGPQQRRLNYDGILPNIGAVFDLTETLSVFGNYSKGIQVPGTDALYNAFFFAPETESARPEPETTDNFDLGLRYRSSIVQAQASVWYTKYQNRLASAYDPETDRNLYRNLGEVEKYGIDGSIAVQPIQNLFLYAFGSYLKSEIKEDVQSGECTSAQVGNGSFGCTTVGTPLFVATAGNREAGAPAYTYGASARGILGPLEIGLTAKRTGSRYFYDTNLPLFALVPPPPGSPAGTPSTVAEVFPAKTNAYWLVNLDARFSLAQMGLERTYVQFNVYNLTDEVYIGNYTSGLNQGNVIGEGASGRAGTPGFTPNAQIGAPRTASVTLVVGF